MKLMFFTNTSDYLLLSLMLQSCFLLGEHGNTAMHVAIWCRGENNLKLQGACSRSDENDELLNTCDVDKQNTQGRTGLHLACQFDHLEHVKKLMSVFVSTHSTDENGFTVIQACVECGHNDVLSYFQQHHMTPEFTSERVLNDTLSKIATILKLVSRGRQVVDAQGVPKELRKLLDDNTRVSALITLAFTPGLLASTMYTNKRLIDLLYDRLMSDDICRKWC
jgi:ankyrin repeat protein